MPKFDVIATLQKSEHKAIQIVKLHTDDGKDFMGLADVYFYTMKDKTSGGTKPGIGIKKSVYFPIGMKTEIGNYLLK